MTGPNTDGPTGASKRKLLGHTFYTQVDDQWVVNSTTGQISVSGNTYQRCTSLIVVGLSPPTQLRRRWQSLIAVSSRSPIWSDSGSSDTDVGEDQASAVGARRVG